MSNTMYTFADVETNDSAPIVISEVNKKLLEIQRAADLGGSPAEIRGEGIVLLKNFNQGTTCSGKPKFSGTIVNQEEAKFNVWNSSSAYEYFEQLPPDAQPRVVQISYTLSRYGFVISSISDTDGYDPDVFIYHKYSVKEIVVEFKDALAASGISENAISVIRAVMHMDYNDNVSRRLVQEYAAYSHHDNCASGLLAHTAKCIRVYNGIKGAYAFLDNEKVNDLMVIGLALHDIGKIYEMHDGVYQANSFLTHRGLGFEHLLAYKQMISDLYDEEFFYMICRVVLQHHGEFGENPRTLCALLVHIVDDVEAQLTSLDELLESDAITTDASGAKIKFNGMYLNVLCG